MICFFVPTSDIRTLVTSQTNMQVALSVVTKSGKIKGVNHNVSAKITVTEPIKFATFNIVNVGAIDDRVSTLTMS